MQGPHQEAVKSTTTSLDPAAASSAWNCESSCICFTLDMLSEGSSVMHIATLHFTPTFRVTETKRNIKETRYCDSASLFSLSPGSRSCLINCLAYNVCNTKTTSRCFFREESHSEGQGSSRFVSTHLQLHPLPINFLI